MKLCLKFLMYCIFYAILSSGLSFAKEVTSDPGWPRMFEAKGNKVVIYQPQLEEWENHEKLHGKAAVVVQLKDNDKEFYGALSWNADTEVNLDARTVLLHNFQITNQVFPNIEEKLSRKCAKAVEAALPDGKSILFSLDRILAGLEGTKNKAKGVAVSLDPPPIYWSQRPAILVLFMGEPKFEAVEGAPGLLYAVNTNWDIILELGPSKYYMLNGESWLVTPDIVKGPWKAAVEIPSSFAKLPDDDNWRAVKKNIPGVMAVNIPVVFVSKEPAELIVTDGAPSYSPISGTKLLYTTNTDSDLFLHNGDGHFYFLTAGRWFKAKSLDGPWSAASANLPDDFRRIPEDHKKAHVLSSVPGTPEAEAAVLLASIPRKATVNRKDTTIKVVYEGEPQFILIQGASSTIYYAINSPYSIFRVDGLYYAVHNGVWFVSVNAAGPWAVCTKVPTVIYTIPPSHPKYNVTYVYVYDSTPDTVVVGYTSGYSGSYVAATGVVMFGLGVWIGHEIWDDHYHHYHYHSHYYSYGSAARYDYYHGGYYHSSRYYGPHGGAGGWSGYDPASGTYYRGGYAQGPYGSSFAREAYNPYTDRYGAQARTKTPYGSWGRTVVADGDDWARAGHESRHGKTVAGLETSKGAKAIGGYNKWTDQGAVVGKDKYGDVYVGRNNDVFKRDDDGWQKNTGDGWEKIDTTAAKESAQKRKDSVSSRAASSDLSRRDTSATRTSKSWSGSSSSRSSYSGSRTSTLNREYRARQQGNRRTRTAQRSTSRGGFQRRR